MLMNILSVVDFHEIQNEGSYASVEGEVQGAPTHPRDVISALPPFSRRAMMLVPSGRSEVAFRNCSVALLLIPLACC